MKNGMGQAQAEAPDGKRDSGNKTREYLWEKRVTEKVNDICQSKIRILSNEFHKQQGNEPSEYSRPYVNNVLVKVRVSDVQKVGGSSSKKSKYEFTQQKFRINKQTTFLDICSVACQFFDVDDD